MTKGRHRRGFSLVELMAAAAIVGILVSLALPRYRLFVARSRMAEAKTNLGVIYGLQQTYRAEFEKWGSIDGGMGGCQPGMCDPTPGQHARNELGFRVTDCTKLRYEYNSTDINSNALSRGSHSGCRVYADCEENDRWNINSGRALVHTHSAVKKCHE